MIRSNVEILEDGPDREWVKADAVTSRIRSALKDDLPEIDVIEDEIERSGDFLDVAYSRVLVWAKVKETFSLPDEATGVRSALSRHVERLVLSRYPIHAVSSVEVDDVEVDLDEVDVYKMEGLLTFQQAVSGDRIAITYSGGYRLPGWLNEEQKAWYNAPVLPLHFQDIIITDVIKRLYRHFRDPSVETQRIGGVTRTFRK